METNYLIAAGGLLGIWLAVVTVLFARERNFLHKLFPSEGARDIRQKFKELIEVVNTLTEKEEKLHSDFAKLVESNLKNIQKVSILRYNPYNDTGGVQSFSVALLDAQSNGFIITSLHSRGGTRVYAKEIKEGKSAIELSKEERELINRLG